MNKTVNINLAGVFFHIDEDAFSKLQHYLESIKRSFANTPGYDEIIADIEARIAELFSEKLKNERQVISSREVDEVIAIMGQPEDYMVDEEIFEDRSFEKKTSRSSKQLYRDTDNAYIGGVSSGLAHYLGIQAIWVRILWILLTLLSSGAFILIYIALWIFVPQAITTAEKLAMRGEPVNITNIERRIKEGFDDVSGKVKNLDYEKYGYRAKAGAGSAATAVGNLVSVLLNIFVKFIGIIILLFSGLMLVSLFIGLFTVGTFGIIEAPWTDYVEMATSGGGTIWIISILSFFAFGIPVFFLFILGLKILVKNLKTIGRTAKLVLLGLWIISVIGLTIFGIIQATEHSSEGEVVVTEVLPVRASDTLMLSMRSNPNFQTSAYRSTNFELKYNENNEKIIFSEDVRLMVRSTKDSVGRLEILKSADGKSHKDARDRAGDIAYGIDFQNNQLQLDSYFTTSMKNKYRDQEVQVVLYLPVGAVLYADDNTNSFHLNSSYYEDVLSDGDEEQYLLITENGTQCLDCPEDSSEDWENLEEDWESEEDYLNDSLDTDGSEINVQINKNGVRIKGESTNVVKEDKNGFTVKIEKNGNVN